MENFRPNFELKDLKRYTHKNNSASGEGLTFTVYLSTPDYPAPLGNSPFRSRSGRSAEKYYFGVARKDLQYYNARATHAFLEISDNRYRGSRIIASRALI